VDTLGKAYMGVLMAKRKRRAFTREFKTETVRLVLERGRTIPEVARELDLTESALRLWVHQAKVDQGQGKPGELTTAEREELHRLRREVKDLRIEREILKKAAAFFAKESK
jgi:transposase